MLQQPGIITNCKNISFLAFIKLITILINDILMHSLTGFSNTVIHKTFVDCAKDEGHFEIVDLLK